LAKYYYGCILP